MVECPSGSFIMGSPEDELGRYNGEVQHKVILSKPFWIGKYPVTQKQYKDVMGYLPKIPGNDNTIIKNNLCPVEGIWWDDGKKFCNLLNDRYGNLLPQNYKFDLPTEAQWEYACRAGTTTALYNGKNLTIIDGFDSNLDEIAWYDKNSNGTTHPVGLKKPNAWGIYDMLGNIYELTRDWSGDYSSETKIDPLGVDFSSVNYRLVSRGGDYSSKAQECRSSCWGAPILQNCHGCGFRVAIVSTEQWALQKTRNLSKIDNSNFIRYYSNTKIP